MRFVLTIFAVALLTACTPQEGAERVPAPESLVEGLRVEELGDGVRGEYTLDWVDVRFVSRRVMPEVLDVTVEANRKMFTALVDLEHGVVEFDGFEVAEGRDTYMTDADRDQFRALAIALDAYGPEASFPIKQLRGFASTWSEFPGRTDMQGQQIAAASFTSICQFTSSYQQATHDGPSGNLWDDRTTINAYVSMHAAGPCPDGTNFWEPGWRCFEPDHPSTIEYAFGNCFGRCGAGCGANTKFTWDCLDHDECVRLGHSTLSLSCQDEFLSTMDDWVLAPDCL